MQSAWNLYSLFKNNMYPFNLEMITWNNEAPFVISEGWIDPETDIEYLPVEDIPDYKGSLPIMGSEDLMDQK